MTYQQVFDIIKAALTLRPTGTKVQVDDHETAEIAILDYVEQLKSSITADNIREAHSYATANVECHLVWNQAFENTNYSFVVNGFDTNGTPVEIILVSQLSNKIVVTTYVNATLTAMAKLYVELPS